MEEREIVRKDLLCIVCKEALAVVRLGGEGEKDLDEVLLCANPKCGRVGLLSVTFTKTKGGDSNDLRTKDADKQN